MSFLEQIGGDRVTENRTFRLESAPVLASRWKAYLNSIPE